MENLTPTWLHMPRMTLLARRHSGVIFWTITVTFSNAGRMTLPFRAIVSRCEQSGQRGDREIGRFRYVDDAEVHPRAVFFVLFVLALPPN